MILLRIICSYIFCEPFCWDAGLPSGLNPTRRYDFGTVKILQLNIRDAEVSVRVEAPTAGAASEGGAEGEGPEGSPEEERLTGRDGGREGETPTNTAPKDPPGL